MKICLINPKYEQGQRAHRIPLGLSYIAAVLKQAGHYVKGYNLDVDPEPDFKGFEVIGIYVSTPMAEAVVPVIRRAAEVSKVILGGPHISANPNFAKRLGVEGIAGEGEYAMLKVIGENVVLPSSLDDIPFPAKKVFDHGNYKDERFAYAAIIASRGCPFKCKNCQPGLRKIAKYRVRSPENVVKEMIELNLNHDVKDFSFEDSELIISKQWALKFCDELDKAFNGKITFQGNARLNQLGGDVLARLKRAGCKRLGIGLESGSQRVLDKCLNKGIRLDKDLPNLSKIKRYGIESHVWIMIGIPGETEQDVRKTMEMVLGLDVSTVEINIATPWPGTDFYTEAKQKGWLVEGQFDEKRRSYFNTPYLTSEMTEQLLEDFKDHLRLNGWRRISTETNTYTKQVGLKHMIQGLKHPFKAIKILLNGG